MNVRQVYDDLVKYENQVVFVENKVIDSLQFLENSGKKLRYAEIEVNALAFINGKIKESYDKWNKDLFHNGKSDFLPITVVEYFGTKLLDSDAIEKIVGSFFHYLHSFFDTFAQFINSCLLGNVAVDINRASFGVIKQKVKELPEYQLIFKELEDFAQTSVFKYIEDFNNINKHQYTLDVQNTLFLNDGQIEQQLPPFQKKEAPHNAEEVKFKIRNSLDATIIFFETVTNMVLNHLKLNNHNYISNRYQNISIRAQQGFDEGQNGGAILLTLDNANITNGDTFHVLLAKKKPESNSVVAQNILTDSIIVQNSNGDHVGVLEALEPSSKNIIKYRKYKVTLHRDMNSVFLKHFFESKTFQMGFGEYEIIQKVDDSKSGKVDQELETSDVD